MVTVSQMLTEYNSQHGTAYATISALGSDLAMDALKQAWLSKRLNDAQSTAISEIQSI